ncbi:hypothetical protein Tco_0316876 [Tanacetum coccineum]
MEAAVVVVGCRGTTAEVREGAARDASGCGDRIDPLMRSIFGLRRKSPPENFSGGGVVMAGGGWWLPDIMGEKGERYNALCVRTSRQNRRGEVNIQFWVLDRVAWECSRHSIIDGLQERANLIGHLALLCVWKWLQLRQSW